MDPHLGMLVNPSRRYGKPRTIAMPILQVLAKKPIWVPLGAAVNISGKPKRHGSCKTILVAATIESLYRTLRPTLLRPHDPSYGTGPNTGPKVVGLLLQGHPKKEPPIIRSSYVVLIRISSKPALYQPSAM